LDDLAWLGLAAGAVALAAAFEWVAPTFSDELAPPTGVEPFSTAAFLFVPEPLEEARFLIAIALPIGLAILVALLGSDRPPSPRFDLPVIGVQLAALGFVGWTATQQSNDVWVSEDFVSELTLGVPVLAGGVAIGLGLTALLFADPKLGWVRENAFLRRLGEARWLAAPLAVVITVLWLLPAVVTEDNISDAGLVGAHIPGQFADYLAAVNGLTPLVDYASWYSFLLPIAFAPLLSAFDSSITSFSVLQVSLSLAAMLCVYAALANITESRWAALCLYVPFVALSFLPWHVYGAPRDYNGLYYAAFPNRYLGPLVVLWLLVRHLRRGSPPLWAVFFVASLAVFNNFDFGACTLVAALGAALVGLDRSESARAALGDLLISAAAGLLGALALVSAVTLIRAGELPDLSTLTHFSSQFGRHGFGLLPMPSWGLHWGMYLTYVAALLVATVRLMRVPSERVLNAALAFSGLLGLTTGQYFAGRSDSTQLMVLFPVWGLALALLTWLTVRSLRGVGMREARRAVIPAFAVLAGFGVMVASIARFPLPWDQLERISDGGPEQYRLSAEQRFVEDHTEPEEPVLIFDTGLDHRVAERAGVTNVSPGSLLITRQEVDRALDSLEREGGTKLFERFSFTVPELQAMFRERGFEPVGAVGRSGLQIWERKPRQASSSTTG
jgi:hypothetical protein